MADEKQIVIYAHDFCGQSRVLIRALDKIGLEYEYRDVVNGNPVWKKELKRLARGNLSVPTVVYDDGTVMVEPWPDQVLDHLGIEKPSFTKRLSGMFGRGE